MCGGGGAFGKLPLGENNNKPKDHLPFFFKFNKYVPSNSWAQEVLLSDQNTVQLAHPLTRDASLLQGSSRKYCVGCLSLATECVLGPQGYKYHLPVASPGALHIPGL